MNRVVASLVILALVVATLAIVRSENARPALPLISADFPVCVTVRPPPLQPQPSGANLYPRREDDA